MVRANMGHHLNRGLVYWGPYIGETQETGTEEFHELTPYGTKLAPESSSAFDGLLTCPSGMMAFDFPAGGEIISDGPASTARAIINVGPWSCIKDFTMTCWFRLASTNNGTAFVFISQNEGETRNRWIQFGLNGKSSSDHYELIRDDNATKLVIGSSGGGVDWDSTYGSTATWYYGVVTYKHEFTGTDSLTTFYQDGEEYSNEQATTGNSLNTWNEPAATFPPRVRIGPGATSGDTRTGSPHPVDVGDVRIYNRCLEHEEVRELYRNSLLKYPGMIIPDRKGQIVASTMMSSGGGSLSSSVLRRKR